MGKTDFAEAYTEKMFPEVASPAGRIDPEFEDIFDNFAYDEVITEEGKNVPAKDRFMAILAALIGSQAIDEYALMMPAALNFGVTPDEVKEIVYQGVPYLGIGRVRPFIKRTNKIFDYSGLSVEKPARNTVRPETRLEKGIEAQVEIFGEGMREFYKSGPEEFRHINLWLARNCFGDYYTRTGLTLAQRELITFCFLMAQGGCESQLEAHVIGNLRLGHSKQYLINVVSQCVPYIGYPRCLNALTCINRGNAQFEAHK